MFFIVKLFDTSKSLDYSEDRMSVIYALVETFHRTTRITICLSELRTVSRSVTDSQKANQSVSESVSQSVSHSISQSVTVSQSVAVSQSVS